MMPTRLLSDPSSPIKIYQKFHLKKNEMKLRNIPNRIHFLKLQNEVDNFIKALTLVYDAISAT